VPTAAKTAEARRDEQRCRSHVPTQNRQQQHVSKLVVLNSQHRWCMCAGTLAAPITKPNGSARTHSRSSTVASANDGEDAPAGAAMSSATVSHGSNTERQQQHVSVVLNSQHRCMCAGRAGGTDANPMEAFSRTDSREASLRFVASATSRRCAPQRCSDERCASRFGPSLPIPMPAPS
jgi:hypothetical protein